MIGLLLATLNVNDLVPLDEAVSVACSCTVNEPVAVGVPETELPLTARPAGREPDVTDHV